jgi:hypothetical protein
MRIRRTVEVFAAAIFVYGVVAACSGGAGAGGAFFDAATEAVGIGGSGVDALLDPVSEAKAAPPEIKEAPCDVLDGASYFAIFDFPAKTTNELARARAIRHTKSSGPTWYSANDFITISDGMLKVFCDTTGTAPEHRVDVVRAILPAP